MNKNLSEKIREDYLIKDEVTAPMCQRLAIELIGLYETEEFDDFDMLFGTLPHCLKEVVTDFIKEYKNNDAAAYIENLYILEEVEKYDSEIPPFRLFRTMYFDFESGFVEILAWHLLRTRLNGNLKKCEKILILAGKYSQDVLDKYKEVEKNYQRFLDTVKKRYGKVAKA